MFKPIACQLVAKILANFAEFLADFLEEKPKCFGKIKAGEFTLNFPQTLPAKNEHKPLLPESTKKMRTPPIIQDVLAKLPKVGGKKKHINNTHIKN